MSNYSVWNCARAINLHSALSEIVSLVLYGSPSPGGRGECLGKCYENSTLLTKEESLMTPNNISNLFFLFRLMVVEMSQLLWMT